MKMKILTAPTRSTLGSLGLDPEKPSGENASGSDRRASVLASHLNRWGLARVGGTGDRPWLGDVSGFGGYPLAEFRRRIGMLERAIEEAKTAETAFFGWEFLLTADLWRSSRELTQICVVHSGFEKECRRLAEETELPLRLAEPLLRSWLRPLYRCSAGCDVVLLSLHEDDDPEKMTPDDIAARASGAEELTDTEMNAADPLPAGAWRLRKGGWFVVASDEDFEVANSLRRLGRPPVVEIERALAHGRNPVQRAVPISPQTFRDARNIELRGIDRIGKERAKRIGERETVKQSERSRRRENPGGGRASIQLGRYFRDFLTRIFSRKRSS